MRSKGYCSCCVCVCVCVYVCVCVRVCVFMGVIEEKGKEKGRKESDQTLLSTSLYTRGSSVVKITCIYLPG